MTEKTDRRFAALRHITTQIQLWGFTRKEIEKELYKDASISHHKGPYILAEETGGQEAIK